MELKEMEEKMFAWANCRNEGIDVEIQCVVDAKNGKIYKNGYRAIVSEWHQDGSLDRNHYLPNRKTYEEAEQDANNRISEILNGTI